MLRPIATYTGCFLIAAGLIGNTWMFGWLFTPVRSNVSIALVWLNQILLIGTGILFLVTRNRSVVQRRLLLTFGGIIIGLLAAESILRMGRSDTVYRAFCHNAYGSGSYRLTPGYHDDVTCQGRAISISINSHGMRWREIDQEKSPGTYRIAFVGDSFTFGLWADSIEQSFVGVVDQQIAASGIEVLNFGVPGYGFEDMLLQLREQVVRFQPNHVVLVTYNGNDLCDTFEGLDRCEIVDGRIERRMLHGIEFTPGQQRWKLLTRHVQLLKLLTSVRETWREKQRRMESADPYSQLQASTMYGPTWWSQSPLPAAALPAFDTAHAVLRRIAEHCRAHEVRLTIVAIPYRDQVVSPDITRPGFDFRSPQRELQAVAEQHSIEWFDLLPLARAAAAGGVELYCVPDSHFSNAGHRFAGEAIARFLLEPLASREAAGNDPI